MVNTSLTVTKSIPEEERERMKTEIREFPTHTNTTEIYDSMVDITEEPVEVTQVIKAPDGMYAVMGSPGELTAVPVDYLISSEGTLWGFSGDSDGASPDLTLETKPEFQGYVIREGADELSTEEIEKLLEGT